MRVGVIPPGTATEVYIAPQTSAKRKAKAKGEEMVEVATAPFLDTVPNAHLRTLDELKKQHGDALRIAVEPEKSFEAITGSHVRVSIAPCSHYPLSSSHLVLETEPDGVHRFTIHHPQPREWYQRPRAGSKVPL